MTARFLNLAVTEDLIHHATAREMPPPRCWYSSEILSLPSFLCLSLTAMMMESLVGWEFVAALLRMNLAARSITDVVSWLQHPASPCTPRSAQWQSSFVPRSWLWQCVICLLAQTSVCCLWHRETDTTWLKMCCKFVLAECLFACFCSSWLQRWLWMICSGCGTACSGPAGELPVVPMMADGQSLRLWY